MPSDAPDVPNVLPSKRAAMLKRGQIAGLLLLLAVLASVPPLTAWQRREQRDALSVNNLRRLAQALLLYAQDWDDRPMPPVLKIERIEKIEAANQTTWRTWPQTLLPYLPDKATLDNPMNPLAKSTTDPTGAYPIDSAYALNSRFYNTFGAGAYPLDALELPFRTALFVEAGPMRRDPLRPVPASGSAIARLDYGDISETANGLFCYPSPHNGKIALVAADGHAETVTAAHYRPTDGPHDKLYGRIGGNLFNWNGGFATGETDRPPRE